MPKGPEGEVSAAGRLSQRDEYVAEALFTEGPPSGRIAKEIQAFGRTALVEQGAKLRRYRDGDVLAGF